MSAFIRRFNVNVHEVVAIAESLYSRLSLAAEIGVYVACCAGNVDYLHTCELADTLKQVNSGNHSALQAVFFCERH